MRKQDMIIMWPAYFDSKRKRRDGRRVPKSLAVSSPKALDLQEAAKNLNLNHKLVLDSAYPKTPWMKTGMLLVAKKETKNETTKKIAKQLSKNLRAAKTK